jgi:hypothetical protein
MHRQPHQSVSQPGPRVDIIELAGLDQRVQRCRSMAADIRSGKRPVHAPYFNSTDRPLRHIARQTNLFSRRHTNDVQCRSMRSMTLAVSLLGDSRVFEEVAPCVCPARSPSRAAEFILLSHPGIGIRQQNAAVALSNTLRMFALGIPRVERHGSRWVCPGKEAVIALPSRAGRPSYQRGLSLF